MEAGIIPKFYRWQPLTPFVGAGMDKAPQISFQALVKPLRLTIGLGVVGGAATEGHIRQLEQLRPEVTCKYVVMIRNDRARKAM